MLWVTFFVQLESFQLKPLTLFPKLHAHSSPCSIGNQSFRVHFPASYLSSPPKLPYNFRINFVFPLQIGGIFCLPPGCPMGFPPGLRRFGPVGAHGDGSGTWPCQQRNGFAPCGFDGLQGCHVVRASKYPTRRSWTFKIGFPIFFEMLHPRK